MTTNLQNDKFIKSQKLNNFCDIFISYFTELHLTGMIFITFELTLLEHPYNYSDYPFQKIIYKINTLISDINFIDFSLIVPLEKNSIFRFKIIVGIRLYSPNHHSIYWNVIENLTYGNELFIIDNITELSYEYFNTTIYSFFWMYNPFFFDFYTMAYFSPWNKHIHNKYKKIDKIDTFEQISYNYTWKNFFFGAEAYKKGKYFIDKTGNYQLRRGRNFLTKRRHTPKKPETE